MANILDRSTHNQQCCLFATVRREPRAERRAALLPSRRTFKKAEASF